MTKTLLAFNLAAAAMTLIGGLGPSLFSSLSRIGLWRMFSLRAGILLSVSFIEVLPEAWLRSPEPAGWGALLAFALFFVTENFVMLDCCPEYLEQCSVHLLGSAALVALFSHALIDGFNLTVSFSAGTLAGAAVGVALALHKLADGFTLISLLRQSGYTARFALGTLVLAAAATPLGSFLTLSGTTTLPVGIQAGLLGFAGGSFLYIGAVDVLPRMHKFDDKLSLVFFAAGVLLIIGLREAYKA